MADDLLVHHVCRGVGEHAHPLVGDDLTRHVCTSLQGIWYVLPCKKEPDAWASDSCLQDKTLLKITHKVVKELRWELYVGTREVSPKRTHFENVL